jgi:hypothetical protein
MIVPLAMRLREQGARQDRYLGHRDGSTVMVRKDTRRKACAT